MIEKDLNKIAGIEKAISDKWGEEAVVNPKANWSRDKEEKYLIQLSELQRMASSSGHEEETFSEDGFYLKKRLFTTDEAPICPLCGNRSTKSTDDVYFIKFGMCENCYSDDIWRDKK
jgi:hypothetical protein